MNTALERTIKRFLERWKVEGLTGANEAFTGAIIQAGETGFEDEARYAYEDERPAFAREDAAAWRKLGSLSK